MKKRINRRTFLSSMTALTLSQLVSGCSNTEVISNILLLENSVPPQLIGDFHRAIDRSKKINFVPITQLYKIFASLEELSTATNSGSSTNSIPKLFDTSVKSTNLATLGDFWLTKAIQQKLIQPLPINELDSWTKLPTAWQTIAKRNSKGQLDTNGRVWGAPYRWGSTVIAYRSDKLEKLNLTPTDWNILWQPELSDRISLLNSPREVIGLTLKQLGYSYNTEDLKSVADLETELLALHRQVKLYSSDNYLQPLILGHTWLAVGWSSDILPLTKRYPNIKVVVPKSGTSLWTDLWVKPQTPVLDATLEAEQSTLINEWIDFCWQLKGATQISLFTSGNSPILLKLNSAELPKGLQNNPLWRSQPTIVNNSEFILPLSEAAEQQYESLWLKIRRS